MNRFIITVRETDKNIDPASQYSKSFGVKFGSESVEPPQTFEAVVLNAHLIDFADWTKLATVNNVMITTDTSLVILKTHPYIVYCDNNPAGFSHRTTVNITPAIQHELDQMLAQIGKFRINLNSGTDLTTEKS